MVISTVESFKFRNCINIQLYNIVITYTIKARLLMQIDNGTFFIEKEILFGIKS